MEEKDLLRTENDEIQNLDATPCADEQAQETMLEASSQLAEVAANEPVATEEPVSTPTPVEPNNTESYEQPATDTIEQPTTEPVADEPQETIEQIENEYFPLSLDQAVEEMLRLANDPDFNKTKARVGVLRAHILLLIRELRQNQKEAFLAADENNKEEDFKPEISEVELRFNDALHIYKSNKEKFLENIEKEKQRNFEVKTAIIEELRILVENETNLKVLNDKFKELQEKWKSVGPVPQAESNNLWQNYHFFVEKFFDILRINKELKFLDLKKNMEQKIKLCEQAEALMVEPSVNKSFTALQNLHEQWKDIGPVPEDKKEELWERFKTASDQINQRRREYYDAMFAEQQNNYNAKIVLCEKAEETIAQPCENANDFNTISDQLTELLNVWKTLGAAPPKVNEDIWNRFKGALDKFFDKKKEFFSKIKEEQQNNYNQKLNLIIQAEAIAERTDWRAATDALIHLQQEWKKIGTTSRKHSETLWKRFRTACDKFFEAKNHYFNNVEECEGENLRKKEDLINRILTHEFSDDKAANLEAMSAFQREWTEIGYVPKKEKDRIHIAYREALNQRFTELKVNAPDPRRNNRNSNQVLGDPSSDRILDKERRFLANKISQLKDEIAIWENNLGFFQNSKNADLLKAEFAKKITAAKEQVKELEFKLKVMSAEKSE